jgi:hypothetical protein
MPARAACLYALHACIHPAPLPKQLRSSRGWQPNRRGVQPGWAPPLCCPRPHPLRLLPGCRGQSTPYQPAISPEPVGHLAQHRLLPLLADAARLQPDMIDLRMGHRWGGGQGGRAARCQSWSAGLLCRGPLCWRRAYRCSPPPLPACSLRGFSQTAEGVTAVVDAAPDGTGDGGSIYRLSGGKQQGRPSLRLLPRLPSPAPRRCSSSSLGGHAAPPGRGAERAAEACRPPPCRAVPRCRRRRAQRRAPAAGHRHGGAWGPAAPHQHPLPLAAGEDGRGRGGGPTGSRGSWGGWGQDRMSALK